jgi:AraC-like DNA-binding protein
MTADIETCLQILQSAAMAIFLEERRKDPLLVTNKVRAYVIAVLAREHRAPLADEVASVLCTTDQTMRRHLHQEGHNFQQIVDDIRLEMAKQLLLNGLNIDDIAYDLGYSAPSGFSRAFKFWIGKSPAHWRRAAA